MDKTDKMLDKLQADLSLIFHKIRNYELLEEKLIKIKTLMEKEKSEIAQIILNIIGEIE